MTEATLTKDAVIEALRTVYDPEIPVNIVDLVLVYDCQVNDEGGIYVQMTLTFPGCGMGPFIAQQAEWAVQDLDGAGEVEIELKVEQRRLTPSEVESAWRHRFSWMDSAGWSTAATTRRGSRS